MFTVWCASYIINFVEKRMFTKNWNTLKCIHIILLHVWNIFCKIQNIIMFFLSEENAFSCKIYVSESNFFQPSEAAWTHEHNSWRRYAPLPLYNQGRPVAGEPEWVRLTQNTYFLVVQGQWGEGMIALVSRLWRHVASISMRVYMAVL